MSECTHNCETCSENCAERKPESLLAEPNQLSDVKNIIAVMSGKGGVGKSTVTAMLAVMMQRMGYKCAILDADVTGPSIPKAFHLKKEVKGIEEGLLPPETETGIKVMSVNLLLPDETAPVVWRGPIIGGTVRQFWTDVCWGDVDYLFVDMPPGTGDVPLTVFQSIPVTGAVVVTSPQDLVTLIVKKAVAMARMMDVPLLGVVENYAYAVCPHCGEKHAIFGESNLGEVAKEMGLPVLAQLPIDPVIAKLLDDGKMEQAHSPEMEKAAKAIAEMCGK
ncbi:MAG: Mrp/NBP35 family ATP-binding protein [Oscillospiraceae bacterium]|nr:Mrp/NBP35 family ATP-binding protein [Oscillospiraceae bacterium]